MHFGGQFPVPRAGVLWDLLIKCSGALHSFSGGTQHVGLGTLR